MQCIYTQQNKSLYMKISTQYSGIGLDRASIFTESSPVPLFIKTPVTYKFCSCRSYCQVYNWPECFLVLSYLLGLACSKQQYQLTLHQSRAAKCQALKGSSSQRARLFSHHWSERGGGSVPILRASDSSLLGSSHSGRDSQKQVLTQVSQQQTTGCQQVPPASHKARDQRNRLPHTQRKGISNSMLWCLAGAIRAGWQNFLKMRRGWPLSAQKAPFLQCILTSGPMELHHITLNISKHVNGNTLCTLCTCCQYSGRQDREYSWVLSGLW